MQQQNILLISKTIKTPLGDVIAIADNEYLYMVAFADEKQLDTKINKLQRALQASILVGTNTILALITAELAAYFSGELQIFTTPIYLLGSEFQKQAWRALLNLPYGHTSSYIQQARMINNPTAYRAVANANGANNIIIVVPCHRIVAADGSLGGYNCGIERKRWLLNHEKIQDR